MFGNTNAMTTKQKKPTADKPKKTPSTRKNKPVGDITSLLPTDRQKSFIKHRVDCKCILPQFKNIDPVIFHKFVVFSVIDIDGSCIPSYAQCNNCGVIHRVTEIGKSEIVRKEASQAIKSIDDIKLSLPTRLVGLLEQAEVDLPTWQEAEFIIHNKMWGRVVLLSKEQEGQLMSGKYVLILGDSLFRVETFEKEIETEKLISG
jgi:hypothetical protein